jgi:hypothetical protein
MGWLAHFKRDLRAKILVLDAEQARMLLCLAEKGTILERPTAREAELLRRVKVRCEEFES